jgi:hypothetical protein
MNYQEAMQVVKKGLAVKREGSGAILVSIVCDALDYHGVREITQLAFNRFDPVAGEIYFATVTLSVEDTEAKDWEIAEKEEEEE